MKTYLCVIWWRHTHLYNQMKTHTFMSSVEDTYLCVIWWRHTHLYHQMKTHTFMSSDEDTRLYVISWRHTHLCNQLKTHTFTSSDEDTHTPLCYQMKTHTFVSSDEDIHLYIIRWRHTPLCHQMKTHFCVIWWRHTFLSLDEDTQIYVIKNTPVWVLCFIFNFIIWSQFSAGTQLCNAVVTVTAALYETPWCKAGSIEQVHSKRKDAFGCSSLDVLTARMCTRALANRPPANAFLFHTA